MEIKISESASFQKVPEIPEDIYSLIKLVEILEAFDEPVVVKVKKDDKKQWLELSHPYDW